MKLFHNLLTLTLIITIHLSHGTANPETFVQDGKIINERTTEEYIKIIKPLLPTNPVILEAGYHGGIDTVKLAKAWPKSTYYAFEPVKKFVEFTHQELRNHNIHHVKVYPYALAETSGTKTFYYSNQIGGASSLLPSNGICPYNDTKMIVEAVNLDEWAQKNHVDHIDFMWLDMEGAEYYVLNAAPSILSTVKVIITEVNFKEFRKGMTQYLDIYNLLTQNGFKLYKIWGSPVHQGTALFVKSKLLKE